MRVSIILTRKCNIKKRFDVKRFITPMIFLAACIGASGVAAANSPKIVSDNITPNSQKTVTIRDVGDLLSQGLLKTEFRKMPMQKESVDFLNVTTTDCGELAELLGDRINEIDSIAVSGPMDETDFRTLWSASFDGHLTAINLEKAEIKDGIVPEDAFWNSNEQIDIENGKVYVIKLKNIILPDGTTKIGESAFAYAVHLEKINLPATIKEIGRFCFSDCYALSSNPLVMPTAMETTSERCFMNCRSLREVVLPPSIREIGKEAFSDAKITSVNFPESLEIIKGWAFHGCRLTEVTLPFSCLLDSDGCQFSNNIELKKASMTAAMNMIPHSCFSDCVALEEVTIPPTVKAIKSCAFEQCQSLRHIELPADLCGLGANAFRYCISLEQVSLPVRTESLAEGSLGELSNLKSIYCEATVPPVCASNENKPGASPFGGTAADTPVYVPVGAADAYRNAAGWSHFTNIVETSDFPQVGVDGINDDNQTGMIYDLSGRSVTNPRTGKIYISGGKKFIPVR